ncbi:MULTISPECIES: hypothetical protein [Vibrio]|uniref:hypothetical protein n=1 Tax=Vibrio TaxID=662 RepID=UPI00097FA7C6|nr:MULTISPECIES: hypothetical protein [Vibrio]AQM66586.1 hypothetical protein Vca1114GL_00063 [Vibrio campbellii]MBM4869346.1 hypothetical protein [Vibrio parahaemolyticus]MCF6455164.1 hypothetical protein [Vibrio sp. MMG023]
METSWQDVAIEAIKILGPAMVTGVAAYFTATIQLKAKLKQIEKNSEYKAREKVFDFKTEKYNKLDKSLATLNETLSFLAGMSMTDRDDQYAINSFVAKYLSTFIYSAPFDVKQTIDQFLPLATEYPREFDKLQKDLSLVEGLKQPNNYDQVNDTIVTLIGVYGFVSCCSKIVAEKEALKVFEPYNNPNA